MRQAAKKYVKRVVNPLIFTGSMLVCDESCSTLWTRLKSVSGQLLRIKSQKSSVQGEEIVPIRGFSSSEGLTGASFHNNLDGGRFCNGADKEQVVLQEGQRSGSEGSSRSFPRKGEPEVRAVGLCRIATVGPFFPSRIRPLSFMILDRDALSTLLSRIDSKSLSRYSTSCP